MLADAVWFVVQTVFWLAAAVTVFWLFGVLFRKNAHHGIAADTFTDFLRLFMISADDGSSCTFRYAGGPSAAVRFTRRSGTDTECTLIVDVVRTSLAEGKLAELEKSFGWWKLTPRMPEEEPSVLLRVEYRVPNFWDTSSGATPSGIARKVFEVLGFGLEARFNYDRSGPVSARGLKRIDEHPSILTSSSKRVIHSSVMDKLAQCLEHLLRARQR